MIQITNDVELKAAKAVKTQLETAQRKRKTILKDSEKIREPELAQWINRIFVDVYTNAVFQLENDIKFYEKCLRLMPEPDSTERLILLHILRDGDLIQEFVGFKECWYATDKGERGYMSEGFTPRAYSMISTGVIEMVGVQNDSLALKRKARLTELGKAIALRLLDEEKKEERNASRE